MMLVTLGRGWNNRGDILGGIGRNPAIRRVAKTETGIALTVQVKFGHHEVRLITGTKDKDCPVASLGNLYVIIHHKTGTVFGERRYRRANPAGTAPSGAQQAGLKPGRLSRLTQLPLLIPHPYFPIITGRGA